MSLSQLHFVKDNRLLPICEKVFAGERLNITDGINLLQSNDFLTIGSLADGIARQHHGNRIYFVKNRHINYTNVCRNKCLFCAYYRSADDADAYVLDIADVIRATKETNVGPIREIHIVGGLNEDLPFEYYRELVSTLREHHPEVTIKAFTAVEIAFFAERARTSIRDILKQLKSCGLNSLPGGGAEIFDPTVRSEICPGKISGEKWLEVMRIAHQEGINSNATMLYGHKESPEARIKHLLALRELQDETNGFLAFLPLPFHPQNTEFSEVIRSSGVEDLKMIAVSRLMLDNIRHIKAYWIMLDLKVAQVSLLFGANDIDGTVIEEHITHEAGSTTPTGLSVTELIRLITPLKKTPVERDGLYHVIKEYGNVS